METQQELSDLIRQALYGAAKNPYQGNDKKVLFVCSMGILRSATGMRLYAGKYNTRSAGTHEEALTRLTPIMCLWADEIVFVNEDNFRIATTDPEIVEILSDCKALIKVLDIPDQYEHMHPELIKAFEAQYEELDD